MTDQPRRRMRSTNVAIGVTALVAAGLSGCSSSPDYAAVCVDPETEERVDDQYCDDDGGTGGVGAGFLWFYLGASSRVPALGGSVRGLGGTYDRSGLRGSVQRGGLPTTGGSSVRSTTRGGFGGTSRGIGG
ncbi:hypothetical protein [Nocardioides perillae]|uniref:tRNA-dihydrouridine synthase n=1 Tax=Nocardioides perillae TaxID=1119534 RepID=A0A7Y9RUI1_9ACTN|nr:hypothetical protein [Nocardioides perillae]